MTKSALLASTVLLFEVFLGNGVAAQNLDCASSLDAEKSTGPELLACIVKLQNKINDLQGAPSASEIASILVSEHLDKIQGPKGDEGPEGKPGTNAEAAQLPSGLVASFLRSETGVLGACPSGWSLFSEAGGRFIVGAGSHSNVDQNGTRLSRHPSFVDLPGDAVGGAETHTLTTNEMPNHSHSGAVGVEGYKAGMLNDPAYHNGRVAKIGASGGGAAHNNMPPYIALYFCKKD